MNNAAAIVFDNVTKSYPTYNLVTGGIKKFLFNLRNGIHELCQRFVALENINLEILRGENFGLIGRNGAGKSTSLGLMAKVLYPDKGTVLVNGRVSPLLELGSGFHAELTGRENIRLNGVLLGLLRQEVEESIEDIIEFSTIGNFIDMPLRTYSSGMCAKLGFAVASTLKPEILLVDEILSVGDIAFAKTCRQRMESFRDNPDITMVFVAHAMDAVRDVCGRAAWIEDHHLRMVGTAAEVTKEYQKHMLSGLSVSVPDYIQVLPPLVTVGISFLDCSRSGSSTMPLHLSRAEPDMRVGIEIKRLNENEVSQAWRLLPSDLSGTVEVHVDAQGLTLAAITGDAHDKTPWGIEAPSANFLPADPAMPYVLRSFPVAPGGWQIGPAVSLPVFFTREGRVAWERWRAELLFALARTERPRLPLWSSQRMVRIVARNVFLQDAVGNFALGVAGLLQQSGIGAQVYAYNYADALAGLVRPISQLAKETATTDVMFYNFSIEDEFLPEIVTIVCPKILYYHNVTPARFFQPYLPEFAKVLERSRQQFSFFNKFNAILANSQYSLDEIRGHLAPGVATGTCPPTLNPQRLHRIEAEPVAVPLDGPVLLWVARMAPHKQPEKCLALFKALGDLTPQARLLMVGGGRRDYPEYAKKFDAALAALPEAWLAQVTLLEDLSDGQLRFLYEHATLLLCTSAHEGFCLPVFEAMDLGLPVAAFSHPAVEETLGGSGLVLPEDLANAARVVAGLLDDSAALARLRQDGQDRAHVLREQAQGDPLWAAFTAVGA